MSAQKDIVATEETGADDSVELDTVKPRKSRPREFKSVRELVCSLKPKKSPIFHQKKVYIHHLKWYATHFARSLVISGILVLFLWAFSMIPFSNPIEAGNVDYFNPYPVAVGFAAFTASVYMVIAYGFFVLLYGFAQTKILLTVAIPAFIWSVGNWFVFLAAGYPPWWFGLDLVSYVIFALLVISTCLILNRTLKTKKNFLVIFGIPILVHLLIIGIYAYIIMPFYRATVNDESGSWIRFFFRLIIHPLINFINSVVTEMFVPDFENTTPFLATGYALGIIVEGAFIGRLMTITIGTGFQSVFTALGLGVLRIFLRATWTRIEYVKNFVKGKVLFCACCQTAEEDIVDPQTQKDIQAAYIHYSMTVENSSVFVITAMFAFFWKHRQVWNLAYTDYPLTEPPYMTLLYSGLIQLVINIVVDFVSVLFETSQGINVFRPIREEPIRMFIWEILNMLQMLLLIIYINRMLPFSGFCGQEANQYMDPCQCHIGIDFYLFNATCNGTYVDSVFSLG